jgi:hypothetical protein
MKGQEGPETRAFGLPAVCGWRIGTGNFCGQNREFSKGNRESVRRDQRSGRHGSPEDEASNVRTRFSVETRIKRRRWCPSAGVQSAMAPYRIGARPDAASHSGPRPEACASLERRGIRLSWPSTCPPFFHPRQGRPALRRAHVEGMDLAAGSTRDIVLLTVSVLTTSQLDRA